MPPGRGIGLGTVCLQPQHPVMERAQHFVYGGVALLLVMAAVLGWHLLR